MATGQTVVEALGQDLGDMLDPGRMTHILVRLLVAVLLGGLLGYERERSGKAAGLRTHILIAAGSAFFIMIPQIEGMAIGDLSRIIQGIATGIGFLGAGAILKLAERQEIRGLTTAADIWLTTAVGVAVGLGRLGSATLGAVIAYLVLDLFRRFDRAIREEERRNQG